MITQYDTSFYVTEDDSHKYSALVEDIAEQDITLYKNQKVGLHVCMDNPETRELTLNSGSNE